jgi:hypothetical protein
MWILTNFGAFFPALRPAHAIADGDDRIFQIRARRREHLDRLRTYYMPDLGPTYELAHTDYEYRADVTRIGLFTGMMRALDDVNYESMKPTTLSIWQDHELHTAYMGIWGTINRTLGDKEAEKPHTYTPGKPWTKYHSPAGRHRPAGTSRWDDTPPEQDALFDDADLDGIDWDGYDMPAPGWEAGKVHLSHATRTPFCQPNADGVCETPHHVHAAPVVELVDASDVDLSTFDKIREAGVRVQVKAAHRTAACKPDSVGICLNSGHWHEADEYEIAAGPARRSPSSKRRRRRHGRGRR